MRYTTFGTTGFEISKITLGTMTWGQQNTEAEGHAQLDYALEMGINAIDTAELYSVPAQAETQGSTERIIGSWLAQTGMRKDLFLASKIAGPLPFAGHIRNPLGYERAQLDEALGKSLDRLRTDYLDLYQLHWPARKTNFFGKRGVHTIKDDVWEDNFLDILTSVNELIQSGRIRHWGLSNETPWGVMRILHLADVHGLPRPVSIQNPYSLLSRSFEVGLAEVCLRENIAGFHYSPLAMGRLSGKYLDGRATADSRLNQFKQYTRYNGAAALEATEAYAAVAQKHGLPLAQLALAFVIDRDFSQSTIIGATSLEQLRENIGSIDVVLSKAIYQELEAIQTRWPDPSV
ncbi:aldo/keto reductase [Neolewinella lacunae]|uniref:Aldo/keto reductase n=1 Tax=Neolewinella lacunae TaxID=1517758 RepID=A0A923PIH9_9BACT|nr:aldo/keto reductase [Neolewinella lacunae]MBC6994695.1 aldo/keto reductase [Neolewinella lacunae]MDN3634567.1 aldo/keto reductase [Neolewinella lacunae]